MSNLSKMNIVIGGGTGLIGSALKSKLMSKGMNIRIISRDPKSSNDLSWKNVESNGLPEDTNVVINLSGRSIGEFTPRLLFPSAYQDFLQELLDSRVKTTQILIKSLPKSTKHFINASAIGFYKPDISRTYTENDQYTDYGYLARLVHDWEEACFGPKLDGVRRVVVRTGVVLAKDGGALPNMYLPHRLGLGGPLGDGQQWFSWIHIDDIANLFSFLITDPVGLGLTGAVNATAPNPVRQGVFSRAFSEAIGAPAFGGHIRTPGFVVRAMLGGERAPVLLEGQRVLPAKALAAGFKFNFPTLESALENLYGKRPAPVSTD